MNINRTLRGYRLRLFPFVALLLPLLVGTSGCGKATPTKPETTFNIANVTVSVTGGTALIQWTTDVPADSQVEYGATQNYGALATEASLSTQHTLELTGLQLQTTYHFRIQSTDASGIKAQSSNFTFATLTEGETAPQPSKVEVSAGGVNATIAWQTNESATGEVEYGEDTSYGLTAKSGKTQLEHLLQLTGLKPETTYHYRIKLTDMDGNVSTSSDFTFKTEAKSETGGGNVTRVNVTARQFQFAPGTIRVKKGDKVILMLRSVDVPHGFGLAAFNVNKVLNPGQDVVVEFTAKKKGDFPFICTVNCGAGHANMKGTLIVE